MKYYIETLGCKVNQYESQAVGSLLEERGHSRAGESDADVVIINTCAVTAESERKSKRAARRLKARNPKALIAVCGCCSQLNPDTFIEAGADVVFGSADKAAFIAQTERVIADPSLSGLRNTDDPALRRTFESLPPGAYAGRARAVLKIQDGCDNGCRYCIIPFARGRSRSLPFAEAVHSAAQLAERGFGEIVLTGTEISSYGADLEGRPCLTDLTEAISGAAPRTRIRLGSLDPCCITESFCRKIAATGKVCRHFHLSLQSGCDATLKRMGRKYNTAGFFEALSLLREYFPGCAAACDLIAGFPGETDEDHSETMEFISKCSFAFMHVFSFSERPGTQAALMEGRLPKAIKAQRTEEVRRAAREMQDAYLQSRKGETLPVLFEKNSRGMSAGRGDNYCEVAVPGYFERGIVKNVQISGVSCGMLVGVTV